jgi:hypothetical protein
MAKPITGKTHVGERREKRPNGDIYVYERITAYDEKNRVSEHGIIEIPCFFLAFARVRIIYYTHTLKGD